MVVMAHLNSAGLQTIVGCHCNPKYTRLLYILLIVFFVFLAVRGSLAVKRKKAQKTPVSGYKCIQDV
jgi:hypothetical protein